MKYNNILIIRISEKQKQRIRQVAQTLGITDSRLVRLAVEMAIGKGIKPADFKRPKE